MIIALAMKGITQMIEVLKSLIEDLRLNHEYCPKEVILQAADELERLAQRTEERNFCPRCGKRLGGVDDIHTCTPPPPEQEPVAWVAEDVCEGQYIDGRPRKIWWECNKGVGTAFYTHPPQEPVGYEELAALGWQAIECGICGGSARGYPQRTWVGLTKEDKDLIEDLCEMMIGDAAFSTIDAILKGKNT
jgi:hypothetical protein